MESTDQQVVTPPDVVRLEEDIVEWVPAAIAARRLEIEIPLLRSWCEEGKVAWRTGEGAAGPIALVDFAAASARVSSTSLSSLDQAVAPSPVEEVPLDPLTPQGTSRVG
ncbi:MAG: hypothetical protein QOG16_803, partial [Actinomycetota bacterium]|nr:hypothetical protein [Actinomycetota bacterium]